MSESHGSTICDKAVRFVSDSDVSFIIHLVTKYTFQVVLVNDSVKCGSQNVYMFSAIQLFNVNNVFRDTWIELNCTWILFNY